MRSHLYIESLIKYFYYIIYAMHSSLFVTGGITVGPKRGILSPGDADGGLHDLRAELLAALRETTRGLQRAGDRQPAERRLLLRRQHHVSPQLFRVWRRQAA